MTFEEWWKEYSKRYEFSGDAYKIDLLKEAAKDAWKMGLMQERIEWINQIEIGRESFENSRLKSNGQ
jgi:hypothetical protein